MTGSARASTPATGAALPDLAPGLEKAFEIELEEGSWQLAPSRGELPSWLRGDYYLNGPSRFQVGELRYRHWLDGDGAVRHLHFDGSGTARFTQRFVETTKRRDEREAGRALYRAFGTHFEGDRLKRGIGLESPANVSVYRYADQLLAFGEQGLPYALDPQTLETRGEFDFARRLNAISPVSAHPCFLDDGSLVNFGISFSARQPSLSLYRFDPRGELVYRRRHPLPYPCSTHDFVISGEHVLFFLSPYLLDANKLMTDGESVMGGLEWRPSEGSRLMVLDLASGDLQGLAPVGHGYCLHLIHAFEDGNRLVVDVVEIERPVYDQYQVLPDLFVHAPVAVPRRRVLDRGSLEVQETTEIDYRLCSDFPALDPRVGHGPYDDFWLLGISRTGLAGRKFFDQVAHLSWSRPGEPNTWTAPEGCYLGGEPVFLPPSGTPGQEEGGAVLCQSFDAERGESAFLLFDAFDPSAGPIAELPLERPTPLGFHAAYYPEQVESGPE